MKTAGIILILFSGTGLGLCKSMELTARLKILEKLAQLLLLLKGEIRCTGATLEDAFLDAAAKMPGEYRLFLKETAGWLQQRPGITFDEIFRECAVRLLPLYRLSEEERESFSHNSQAIKSSSQTIAVQSAVSFSRNFCRKRISRFCLKSSRSSVVNHPRFRSETKSP